MRIDDNSFYIRYFVNTKRGESAYLVHYKVVWDNGFSIDSYTIDEDGISFEDASWNGTSTDDSRAGTRILKRDYDKWVSKIEAARDQIDNLVKNQRTPFDREIMIGDYLYIPFKEVFEQEDAAEREELGDEYEEEENKYEGIDIWLLEVTGINENQIEGRLIIIDQYNTNYRPNPRAYSLSYLDRAFVIPKELYEEVKTIIKSTSSDLLAEMKQKAQQIET